MVPDTEWICVKCGPIRECDILEPSGRCTYCFNAVIGQDIPDEVENEDDRTESA